MMLRRQHSMTCRIRHKIVRQFVACLVIPSVLYRRLGDTGFDHLTTLGFVEIPAVILTFAAVSRDRPHISPLLSVLQFGHGPEMEKSISQVHNLYQNTSNTFKYQTLKFCRKSLASLPGIPDLVRLGDVPSTWKARTWRSRFTS